IVDATEASPGVQGNILDVEAAERLSDDVRTPLWFGHDSSFCCDVALGLLVPHSLPSPCEARGRSVRAPFTRSRALGLYAVGTGQEDARVKIRSRRRQGEPSAGGGSHCRGTCRR